MSREMVKYQFEYYREIPSDFLYQDTLRKLYLHEEGAYYLFLVLIPSFSQYLPLILPSLLTHTNTHRKYYSLFIYHKQKLH